MLTEERHERILELVHNRGFVTIPDLVHEQGVSEATIRRDLDALAHAGRLRRLRGGAGNIAGTVRPEQDARPFAEVARVSAEAKRAIARRAVAEVHDDEVIALDAGTTVASMSEFLVDRSLTVATASLAIVEALENAPGVDLIVIGGILRPSYRSMVGTLAVSTINQLRFDRAFLGTSGVEFDGAVLDSSPSEVPMKQAILASARTSYLLADAEKFPGTGLQKVADTSTFDAIITDLKNLALPEAVETEVLIP